MASVILADNGVSSGSAGLKSSADSSGVLALASGTGTTAVTIDASQNVGVSLVPDADAKVQVNGGVRALSGSPAAFNFNNGFTFSSSKDAGMFSPANGVVGFATAGAERARIDSSGNLLVGTTSTLGGAKTTIVVASAVPALAVANSATADSTVGIQVIKSGATNNTSQRYIGFNYNGGGNGNGAIAGNGDSQATFISLSDERLKENIQDLPSQLDNVMALRPVEFDYKATGGHQIGFIAQEVQAVYPDLVSEGDDGYLTLAGFDKNTARLIKAIQELNAKFEEYKAAHP